jgi:hypothetical protein
MARFSGLVGFGQNTEVRPGIWKDVITERPYFGDVKRLSRQLRDGEHLNNDLTVNNSIEIVADAFANENLFAIRYVDWAGGFWTVEDVTVQAPRLVLRLGGVYNGPRADRAAGS